MLAESVRFRRFRTLKNHRFFASRAICACLACASTDSRTLDYRVSEGDISLFAQAKTFGVILERTRRIWALSIPRLGVRFFAPLRMTGGGGMTVGGENTACIHVYLYTALHLYLFTLHFSLFPSPVGSLREGAGAVRRLKENALRYLCANISSAGSFHR